MILYLTFYQNIKLDKKTGANNKSAQKWLTVVHVNSFVNYLVQCGYDICSASNAISAQIFKPLAEILPIQLKTMDNQEFKNEDYLNPKYWKWGIFYYNRNDKRIFPPKRNKSLVNEKYFLFVL